jgi:UDP-N-acetylglucosamine:LPS N-acetylglucosamine transferase
LLSRFNAVQTDAEHKSNEITAVVSGPEPHRSILEKKLNDLLGQLTRPSLLITGKPQEDRTVSKRGSLRIVSHLDSAQMTIRLMKSDVLILRPGYSTLMDLCALGRTAICIPTPGQTEQEYLAELHNSSPLKVIHQNDIQSLPALLENELSGCFSFPVNTGVKSAIDRLLQSIA